MIDWNDIYGKGVSLNRKKGIRPKRKEKEANTAASRTLSWCLRWGWQLRTGREVDSWIAERGPFRLFMAFNREGKFVSTVLVHRDREQEYMLNLKQTLLVMMRKGDKDRCVFCDRGPDFRRPLERFRWQGGSILAHRNCYTGREDDD